MGDIKIENSRSITPVDPVSESQGGNNSKNPNPNSGGNQGNTPEQNEEAIQAMLRHVKLPKL